MFKHFGRFTSCCLLLLTAPALVPGTANALPAAPTNIQVFHRSGQTFITWDEVPGLVSYRIYRDSNQMSFVAPPALGEVDSNSTLNTRATVEGGGTKPYRIVEGVDLPLTSGLFVHTTEATGSYFYTVTSVDSTGENTSVNLGQNATIIALAETLAVPQPVLQRTLDPGNGRLYDIYVHWTSNVGTALYPKMCVVPSKPFTFMVMRWGSIAPHPLVLRLHAYGGNYWGGIGGPYIGIGIAQEWTLSPDDHLDNDILSTHWYGYNDGLNWATGQPVPTSGTNVDYTLRRVSYTLDWALAHLAVDPNRVYAYGTSMGGIGATFVGHALGDRIAARFGDVPKFDFSFLTEVNPGSQFNPNGYYRAFANRIWGTVATDLPCSDGIPTYSRLNYSSLVGSTTDDLPPLIAFFGRNDNTVGWGEKIATLAAVPAAHQACNFFWDSRQHVQVSGDSLVELWPMDVPVTCLNDYRLNRSYPAFSNCSANGNPGTGDPATADQFGTINGHVRSDTAVVDQLDRWEIVVRNRDLTYTLDTLEVSRYTKTAPESIWVDITPRRLQVFWVTPGAPHQWIARNATDGSFIDSNLAVADGNGVITVPNMLVTNSGTRLTIYAAGTTGVASISPTVGDVTLSPNPTTGASTMMFRLDAPGIVTRSVFDPSGRQVFTTGPVQFPAGKHAVSWDGTGNDGVRVSSGVYFYRLETSGTNVTRKLTLLR